MVMKVIGLCGGSGSGKGTVASVFEAFGIPSIDTDAVYHDITSHPSHCLSDLTACFGEQIAVDGRLDRKKLRDIVFSPPDSAEKLKLLNSITHKYIIEQTEIIVAAHEKNGVPGVIIDAPLLFEAGLEKRCDLVIAVTAGKDTRISRIMLRDGITFEQAELRISSQLSDERLSDLADIVIVNDGTLEELKEQTTAVYNQIFANN